MKRFSVERNMQCLCGSGKKYKNCCIEILSNISEHMDMQKEINHKNFELALKYARANLTQYMAGVKRETELFLLTNPTIGESMLREDLKGLELILERVKFILEQGNLDIDFISMLNNLKTIFNNKSWHEILTYYKLSWLYFHQENIEEAEAILYEFSYKDISNTNLLQLFLEIKRNELSFSTKSEILDKLIQKINRFPDKLQYMAAKGVEYLFIGDSEQAKHIFIDTILIAEKNIETFKETHDYFQLANLYNTAASLCENKSYVEKAITYYLKILKDKNATPKGISNALVRLGKAYMALGDETKAFECYYKSIEIDENPSAKIFIADAYIGEEEFNKAFYVLENLNSDELYDEEKMDFIFLYAQLVLLTNNKDKVGDILIKLKELKVSSQYYNDIKNSLIIDLQEVFYSLSTQSEDIEETKVNWLLRKINDYVQLQPNWNGIGVNINKMISDYLEKQTK